MALKDAEVRLFSCLLAPRGDASVSDSSLVCSGYQLPTLNHGEFRECSPGDSFIPLPLQMIRSGCNAECLLEPGQCHVPSFVGEFGASRSTKWDYIEAGVLLKISRQRLPYIAWNALCTLSW